VAGTTNITDNPPPTLLLVDDDGFMLELLADMLAGEGYRLLCARSGAQALELLAQHRVQVLVCDQCMPGMNGTELCARVHALQPQVYSIILSAQESAGPIAAALAGGTVDRYHAKPWKGDEIRASVRDAVRLQRARDSV
jgi:CheY-like chemotaxis protein